MGFSESGAYCSKKACHAIAKPIRPQRRPVNAQFDNRRSRTVVTIGYRLVRPRDAGAAGR
jgi:hypothetical protein